MIIFQKRTWRQSKIKQLERGETINNGHSQASQAAVVALAHPFLFKYKML
jgi:hypothetical protein